MGKEKSMEHCSLCGQVINKGETHELRIEGVLISLNICESCNNLQAKTEIPKPQPERN